MNKTVAIWRREVFMLFVWVVIPFSLFAEVKVWTGAGGDGRWDDALNWSGGNLPVISDEVLLDNRLLAGTYQVVLPDGAVSIHSLTITPSPGYQIELVLPASNVMADALTITGTGYGMLLNAGAVFRNSSGLAGGESLMISDSIRINDGARYIHGTRAAHATRILNILSTAPGTENGIFEFDVPRASYTVSVSNRVYGSLVFSSTTYGSPVNYTGSGSNPLRIRGDLRIGVNVNLSMNLSGAGGNIAVDGNFVQEGGTLNLGSGTANSSELQIRGDCLQSAGALISATSAAGPAIVLAGSRLQQVALSGAIGAGIIFRENNPAGARLMQPLRLPYRLELMQGALISSTDRELVLEAGCGIVADSTKTANAYVDGPLRKEGLKNQPWFLFPVGRNGSLRWLELKQATGSFTVEYMSDDPASLNGEPGAGLDHVSKTEYWRISADQPASAFVELSFASPQSGGVTDPDFLHVSELAGLQWTDDGNTGISGGPAYGSVISSFIADFSSQAYTLASTVALENPLPLVVVQFTGKEKDGYAAFSWSVGSPEEADHFELEELEAQEERVIAVLPAGENNGTYSWTASERPAPGLHYYRLRTTDKQNNSFLSKTISIRFSTDPALTIRWVPGWMGSGSDRIMIHSPEAGLLDCKIWTLNGRLIYAVSLSVPKGEADFLLPVLPPGVYIFCASDWRQKMYTLRLIK